MTTIRTSDGFSYTLTDRDRAFLVTSAKYEGESDPADIFWVYAQRLALRSRRGTPLADVIKYHSQPVNPKWRRDGEFCSPGGRYYGQPNCSETWLARRDRANAEIQEGWQNGDPRIVRRLVEWEAGRVPNAIGKAVDFAARSVAQGYVDRNPGSQIAARKDNWFVAYPESLAWPEGFVSVSGGEGGMPLPSLLRENQEAVAAGGVGLLLLAAGAVAAFYLGRGLRR